MPRPSVLIVDDELAVLALLRRILGRKYHVSTASDGREAVDACIAARRIDLMLVDVMLGGDTGPDVVIRCRKHQPDSKVIYMSGYPDDVLRNHGIDSTTRLLRKPFLPNVLLDALAGALPSNESQAMTFTIAIANDGKHFHVSLDGEPQSSHATQRDAEEAADRLLHEMMPAAPPLSVPAIPAGGIFELPVEAPTA